MLMHPLLRRRYRLDETPVPFMLNGAPETGRRGDTVLTAILSVSGRLRTSEFTGEDRAAVARALSAVGLEGFENRPIDTLSGGQLQRALFARVLVQDAELILLDEPFNAIDARTVADLVALIRRWHGEKRTVIVVSHDMDLVRAACSQVAVLDFGKVITSGPPAKVLAEPVVKKAYLGIEDGSVAA